MNIFTTTSLVKKTQKILAFFAIGIFFSLAHNGYASNHSMEALDSIAGYGSEIIVQKGNKNSEISVILHSPLNEKETFTATTNDAGNANIIIPKKYTYEAGIYSFVVVPKGFEYEDGKESSFEIFADDPSPSLSKINTEEISLATGTTGKVSVLLQDQYGNKIADHRVQLVSSRSEDIISPLSGNRTDKNGQIVFTIESQEEGNSRLSAIDETASISLKDRKNILFYDNTPSGASRFSASMFGAGGDEDGDYEDNVYVGLISEFIVDFPNTVEVNSSDNFLTITAVDAQGNTVENFTGTIFIRIPDDENAEIPGKNGKYTFLKRDQGIFTFSQSLAFSQTGAQKIEVFLYDIQKEEININIFGKKIITVEEEGAYQRPIEGNDVKILTPENDSKFSSSNISLTGTSVKNSDVKIFLDGTPYKTLSTDDSGVFNLILQNIEDGDHSVYVQQVEGVKNKSPEVDFSVDSTSPGITNVNFSETTVTPEKKITISLKTEEDAEEVVIRIGNEGHSLKNIDEVWTAEFSAPEKVETYPVLAIIIDNYGNTSKQTLEEEITVKKENISEDILTGEFSLEKNAIILEWKNSLEETPILYILSTGNTEESLKKSKSVSGSTTRIEYKDFETGEKIFVAITPVDATGKEGATSNIISVQTKEKKPEVIIPDPEPEPTQPAEKDPIFSLESENGQLNIRWESSKNIDHYTVMYGMSSGEYLQKKKKTSFENTDILNDIIPEKKYFVRLLAQDSLGNTIFDYGEKSAQGEESIFHASAPVQSPQAYPQWITKTGPQFFLFIGAIFFMVGGAILSRRKV